MIKKFTGATTAVAPWVRLRDQSQIAFLSTFSEDDEAEEEHATRRVLDRGEEAR